MKKCYYIKSNCLNSFYCFSYTTYDIQIKKKKPYCSFLACFHRHPVSNQITRR